MISQNLPCQLDHGITGVVAWAHPFNSQDWRQQLAGVWARHLRTHNQNRLVHRKMAPTKGHGIHHQGKIRRDIHPALEASFRDQGHGNHAVLLMKDPILYILSCKKDIRKKGCRDCKGIFRCAKQLLTPRPLDVTLNYEKRPAWTVMGL